MSLAIILLICGGIAYRVLPRWNMTRTLHAPCGVNLDVVPEPKLAIPLSNEQILSKYDFGYAEFSLPSTLNFQKKTDIGTAQLVSKNIKLTTFAPFPIENENRQEQLKLIKGLSGKAFEKHIMLKREKVNCVNELDSRLFIYESHPLPLYKVLMMNKSEFTNYNTTLALKRITFSPFKRVIPFETQHTVGFIGFMDGAILVELTTFNRELLQTICFESDNTNSLEIPKPLLIFLSTYRLIPNIDNSEENINRMLKERGFKDL